MKRLLICSIIRDSLPYLDCWFDQLLKLQTICANEYEIFISAYENDSTDGTDIWLSHLAQRANTFAGKAIICCENLSTIRYGSIWNIDRLKNLAMARQRCLNQAQAKWGLDIFDKIAYAEVDVTYDPTWISELILANHPRAAGVGEPDIYSGWSLRSEAHPKESVFLFDTCTTRQTDKDTCWNFARDGDGSWRGESLVKTPFTGFQANCLHSVWSTFNCFCVYNVQPFIHGARWGFVNHRLNTGQEWIDDGVNGKGHLDADTSVMCEKFRARGYDRVFLNTNCLVRHLT